MEFNKCMFRNIEGQGIVARETTIPVRIQWEMESRMKEIASHLTNTPAESIVWKDATIDLLDMLSHLLCIEFEDLMAKPDSKNNLREYLIEHDLIRK